MLFSGKLEYPIGLDISPLSLKLVQFNKKRGKIRIQALDKIDLPSGLIVGGEIKNKPELIKILKEFIAKPKYGRVTSDRAIVCLPETRTFVKLIEVERGPNNLSDIMEAEIEKNVPMLMDEIYYDWQVIERRKDSYSVLIGAAPRKIVDEYNVLFNEVELLVEAMEIEPLSLTRSLLKEESPGFAGGYDKNYILIDMGATRTSLVFYSRNTILFTISLAISGEKITNDIAETLKITREQAEKAKVLCGLDEERAEGVIGKILFQTITELNAKINEGIKYYENYYSARGPLSQIILCGGGANIRGIAQIISQAAKIGTQKGDSLINLNEPDKALELFGKIFSGSSEVDSQNTPRDHSLIFTTAIGLGLRGLFIDNI